MNVRIRGIYTTALTELLSGFHEIVQASAPIRERFETSFEATPADVAVSTTDDRQGVGIVGTEEAVSELRSRLQAIGRDSFVWNDPTPKGAVFRGVVSETLGSGAIVDLGDGAEGFLPYDRASGYVDDGDRLQVQIARSEPPWSDGRPSLATDLRVPGGLLELRYDSDGGGRSSETARMAEILPVDPPDGWDTRWSPVADDADLGSMAEALERAGEHADVITQAVADADDTAGPIVLPFAGAWVWFGRESRFALDETRRAVTATMPGHHRIKAATSAASAAVDFAEAVCVPEDGDGEFPFDAVTRQFGPREGETVAIAHGKPDGRRIVLGRGNVTERDPDGTITVEREMTGGGSYDAIGVPRREGDIATTTFVEGRWWYATVYTGADGNRRGTYVNVCTPVEVFPEVIRYVDLHVDVVKDPDGTVRRVDDDELDEAVTAGEISEPLAERARAVAASLQRAL